MALKIFRRMRPHLKRELAQRGGSRHRGVAPSLADTAVKLLVAASLLATAGNAAWAACWVKGAKGKGTSEEIAKLQAWEAVLQASDWGSYAKWQATGAGLGVSPGWTVSDLRSRCEKAGSGFECTVQARLCKD